jgi:adenine-specific DNA-methyltransferase
VFIQIGDENLHHVRELLDETFGPENFVAVVTFAKTSGATSDYLPGTCDYLLFYAKDIERLKFQIPYVAKTIETELGGPYQWIELKDGTRQRMTRDQRAGRAELPEGARVFRLDNLQSQSAGREKGEGAACWFPVKYGGREWLPSTRSRWKTNEDGMDRLLKSRRLESTESGAV